VSSELTYLGSEKFYQIKTYIRKFYFDLEINENINISI